MSSSSSADEHHFDELIARLERQPRQLSPVALPPSRRRHLWTRNVGVGLLGVGVFGAWLIGFQQALVEEGVLASVWLPFVLVQIFVAVAIAWALTSRPVADVVRAPQPRIDPSYRTRSRATGTLRRDPSPRRHRR